ncbi:MAG: L,D-transpeptidase [Lachnospiraceae bacterium]|nr:L,D-transpeptidase [Lachnospiraceae bacterium]
MIKGKEGKFEMKKLSMKLLTIAMLAILALPFCSQKETLADGVQVNYLFTGFAIPEGQPEVFVVDAPTIEIMRQNPAVIDVFVAALAEKYNTSFAVINQDVEKAYLAGVVNGTSVAGDHIPCYMPVASEPVPEPQPEPAIPMPDTNQILSSPVNMDINAGNYIDVNITTQTLTLFQNGAAVYAAPVVTGKVSAGHSTPEGLFSVQYKQLNRTLKGPDYESFVHYWMRIVNNVGIHDASWRSSFGGQIYKTSGSHGCINVPPSLMPALYSACPEGTPVWVHS